PQEIVIIDDASQDRTLEILTVFKANAPFEVTIISNFTNQGLTENPWNNFFRATALCKHELVSFCDQDDIWYPSKLEILSKPLIENKEIMLSFCNTMVTDENLNTTGLLYSLQKSKIFSIYDFDLLSFLPLGFTQLFRKSLIPDSWKMRPRGIYFDRPMAHDEFVSLLAMLNGKISYCSQELALYRRHNTAHSISSDREKLTDIQSKRNRNKLKQYRELCSASYNSKSEIYLNWTNYLNLNFNNDRFKEAIYFYEKIYNAYKLRAKIYEESDNLLRIKYFFELIKNKYFLHSRSDMRFSSLIKDCFFSII
ncbi:MAG: glycosyltransferase, partial [Dolichospermum sp.]